MRVLLTTDTVGGVWTFTRELTVGLLRAGHAVALVSFGRLPNAAQRAWVDSASAAGDFRYAASDLPLEWMNENDRAIKGSLLIERIAAAFAPDLLHSNQFCFGKVEGCGPRLLTAHSDVLSWAAACRPAELDHTPWLRRYRRLVQEGLTQADAVAAPTLWMLEALGERFALPAMQAVILNGRDLPAPQPQAERALQAVTVGRLWDEAKGMRVFEDLDLPFPVVAAGELRGEDGEAGVSTGLSYAGMLDEQDLLALFGRSAVYIAASLYEPFGLAPLEAALCGCAVIANDIPSLREVWGEHALYFSGKDGLRRLLAALQQDARMLADARQRSKARAHELTATRMTEAYIALYGRLLAGAEATAGARMAYAH